ncbi:MAG: 3-hydroxyacyl-CoA dehydrogenase family protein [Bacteroidales bacterium]|nr:3-hydroxyacyl-CoA dehydrogenase family protein [Bacteroidales bacterium]
MDYLNRLQKVSVLGAAGKMGSGILLLTALEMAEQLLKPGNNSMVFVLNAIDTSEEGLKGLLKYIRSQVLKSAEKKVVQIRLAYSERADLIENSDVIDAFVLDVMSLIKTSTRLESAYDSTLVFEAVSENQTLKEKIFRQINENNPSKPWFFTNTSSVPIGELNRNANLEGRLLGFHFYNPPAIQKLVELITIAENSDEMKTFAMTYAKNLKKIIVPSNDIAGFIGNGHFMRDALYGISVAESLSKEMPLHQAIYVVDRITRDFLMRPMGIFQLIDYVGLDVVQFILRVMQPHMHGEKLHSELLDELVMKGIKGGQFSDGSQKDGFFRYVKGKPVEVIAKENFQYLELKEFAAECDNWMGELPPNVLPWKNLVKHPDKEGLLGDYFKALRLMNTRGAAIAISYAEKSREIARKLISDGVAHNETDVNTVLLTGFFHAYGPISNFI